MRNKKYIMCSGLAFADKEDMEMLHRYAVKGWVFREFRFGLFYVLHKEEPQDLIFSYDIQKVRKKEKEDYLCYFEEAGWTLIPKWNGSISFFSAPYGTAQLHTIPATRNQQFKKSLYQSLIFLLVGIVMMVVGFRMNLALLFVAGAGCIGGSVTLGVSCFMRTNGKRLAWNPRTYGYQLIKFGIGVAFLFAALQHNDPLNNVYGIIVLIVASWFILGSLYGAYTCHKEKKTIGK